MPDDVTVPAEAGKTAEQSHQEAPKTFTQDEVNRMNAEEKRAWQKQIKELKAKADEWDKLQEASKSEMEKLTGELTTHKTDAQQARLETAKVRALARAGADPEKIDALLKRVVGSTPEEIEVDVKELASLGLLAAKTPQGAQGAGNPGLQQQAKAPDIDEQIKAAEKAGNVSLAISLKMQKQGLR